MKNQQFMTSLLAKLVKLNKITVDTRDFRVHQAFAETISKVGEDKLASHGVEFYQDPISETIPDLFLIISIFQGFDLASRPNPTYPEAKLGLTNEGCDTILASLSPGESLIVSSFAQIFAERLDKLGYDHTMSRSRTVEECLP